MENRVSRVCGIAVLLVSLLAGCASAPPSSKETPPEPSVSTKAIYEARAMVREARTAGQRGVEPAEMFLRQAEEAKTAGDEKQALLLSEKAKQSIVAGNAIAKAKPVVASALREAGPSASDSGKLLEAAEAALKAGDPLRATELSAQARRQAENAMEQKRNPVRAGSKGDHYRVVRGDSLWSIAAKNGVYGNPLSWPLLFQTNRSVIQDADLIRPGLELTVGRGFSFSDQMAAQRHARERGEWQVGPVEPTDSDYLER